MFLKTASTLVFFMAVGNREVDVSELKLRVITFGEMYWLYLTIFVRIPIKGRDFDASSSLFSVSSSSLVTEKK